MNKPLFPLIVAVLLAFAVILAGCTQPQANPPGGDEPSLGSQPFDQPGVLSDAAVAEARACLQLKGVAKDNCLRLLAVKFDSTAPCAYVSQPVWAYCVMDAAHDNRNPVHCSEFTTSNLKNACFKTLALLEDNSLYCTQMVVDSEHSKASRDDCFRAVAKNTFDPELCRQITPGTELEGVKLRDDCYYWVALGNYSDEFCAQIDDAQIKSDCIADVPKAIEYKEKRDACNALEDAAEKSKCFDRLTGANV